MDRSDKTSLEERILHAAGIGGWEMDLETKSLFWTTATRAIHETPDDYQPKLDDGLSYYPEAAREPLTAAIEAACANGTRWDLELPFISATGRHRRVRTTGQAVYANGQAIRLIGSIQDVTEQSARAAEMERLSLVVRQMTNAVIITDAAGRTEWVNPAFERLTGYTALEFHRQKPGAVLQGPLTDRATVARIGDAVRRGAAFEEEIVNYTRTGEAYWISIVGTPLRDAQGILTGFIAVESDVTDRRSAEASLRAEIGRRETAELLLREVLDVVPNPIAAFDPQERLVLCNEAYRNLLPPGDPTIKPGATLESILVQAVVTGRYAESPRDEAERRRLLDEQLATYRVPGGSTEIRLADGRVLQARHRRSPSGYLVGVRTDVTGLKAAEQAARRQADEDALTGLVNRNVLIGRLDGQLRTRRSGRPDEGSLILFDIDHFKAVNDTMGHDAGDLLLQEIANRLRQIIRPSDTAARLGGDEFALLLPGLTNTDDVIGFLSRLLGAIEQPFLLQGRQIRPMISAGVTIFPRDGRDAAGLFKNADLAQYDAKRAGRGRWHFFDGRLAEAVCRRGQIAEGLRAALASDSMTIVLQPKRRLADHAHVGFEVLARWPDGAETIGPAEFIPVAEANQMMVPLGNAILRKALQAWRALQDEGLQPGSFAVNISAAQLLEPNFADSLRQMLRDHDMPPDQLELELTETILLDRSAQRIGDALLQLQALGVSFALDDFGTGYASLAHLQRYPLQWLKIDASFVSAIGQGSGDAVIPRTIIGLAHGLGMRVVAEGVERQDQAEYLSRHGCDVAQGYLIARPLTLAEVRGFLRKRQIRLVDASATAGAQRGS